MSDEVRIYAKSVDLERDIYGFLDSNDRNFDDFVHAGLEKAFGIINKTCTDNTEGD